jgi:hypothetical protein
MDDLDRILERHRQTWLHQRRLGVKGVICERCGEADPRCFIGDFKDTERRNKILIAPCERCQRRAAAPTNQKSIDEQWQALTKKGVTNRRCMCGEDNPFCMEADHLDGRKSSTLVIGRCINCHLKRTSRQLTEYPKDDLDPRHPHVVMRNRARAMAEDDELKAALSRTMEEYFHKLAMEELRPSGN